MRRARADAIGTENLLEAYTFGAISGHRIRDVKAGDHAELKYALPSTPLAKDSDVRALW